MREGGREVGGSARKTAKPTNSDKTRSKHHKSLRSSIAFLSHKGNLHLILVICLRPDFKLKGGGGTRNRNKLTERRLINVEL